MYTLTPETLIRIEDASDPKRGFILKPWGEIRQVLWRNGGDAGGYLYQISRFGVTEWDGFKLTHPDTITEVD